MVIFQYNLYIFVWIKHGCLTNTFYAMDPNNSVIKRLRCITDFSIPECTYVFTEKYFKYLNNPAYLEQYLVVYNVDNVACRDK